MKVEVFSLNAAVQGKLEGTTWSGDLPLEGQMTQSAKLERIFRLLNRVDPGDHERMESWGYKLPSLSVGDFVTIHEPFPGIGTEVLTFQVDGFGFKMITGDRNVLMEKIIGSH